MRDYLRRRTSSSSLRFKLIMWPTGGHF